MIAAGLGMLVEEYRKAKNGDSDDMDDENLPLITVRR